MKQSNKEIRKSILQRQYTGQFQGISTILYNITLKSRNGVRKNIETKFNDLYSLLYKKELLIQALGNIEKNKGRLTKGVDNSTIDGTSLERINKIAKQIKEGTYKFKPVLRIEVPKPKLLKPGEPPKMRPLGLPTFEDKLVQEALRIILESIYEPIFEKYNCNYGFREKKNTHQAILKIKYYGTGSNLAIEGDIKGAYDNVNHKKLMEILGRIILDKKFLNFIYQGLKAGIMDQGTFSDPITGVPQGGIVSPLLFNIYMHDFDTYIYTELQEFINQYNTENQRNYKPRSKSYDKTHTTLARAKQKLKNLKVKFNKPYVELDENQKAMIIEIKNKIKLLDNLRFKLPSIRKSRKQVKLVYIRYADDFILLLNCTKSLASEIKLKMENWLKDNLYLELSKEKTLITNLELHGAKFLGISVKTYKQRKIQINKLGSYTKKAGWNMIIDIDQDRIMDRLKLNKFINRADRPIAKNPWSVLQPQEIITRYNYLLRGIANYYFPILDRLSHLNRIFYIYKFSCMGTLAKKFKSKITKIRKKYGDPVSIKVKEIQTKNNKTQELEKTYTLLTYKQLKEDLEYTKFDFKDYKLKHENSILNPGTDIFRPMQTINWRTYKNLENVCAICGSQTNVEQHHIKHIRKGKVTGFSQVMKQLNRKMIPLCRTHHQEVEKGKYDGINLSELIDIERLLL